MQNQDFSDEINGDGLGKGSLSSVKVTVHHFQNLVDVKSFTRAFKCSSLNPSKDFLNQEDLFPLKISENLKNFVDFLNFKTNKSKLHLHRMKL